MDLSGSESGYGMLRCDIDGYDSSSASKSCGMISSVRPCVVHYSRKVVICAHLT